MLKSMLSSPQVTILEKAISAASLRHKVISNNIANINTPGFKRSDAVFEENLRQALENNKKGLPLVTTHERHLGKPVANDSFTRIHTIRENSYRTDGNNVDIDVEMANMAKNSIYHDATVQQISRHFSAVKSAINEGRK